MAEAGGGNPATNRASLIPKTRFIRGQVGRTLARR